MYAWSLQACGLHVIGAASTARALELAAVQRPAVIVTDFTLPGADGFALATAIRAHAELSAVPMVLLSGRAFTGDSGSVAERLFDRVLLKPILPDALVEEIRRLLPSSTVRFAG
jgi:two-component system, cell cycle response regulator DivK